MSDRTTPARLLVVRLGSLGDLVHTLPAVAALRRAHPLADIDWLVDAVHAEFLALSPVVTRVVPLGERSARGWWIATKALRARRYDIAIDFQGLIKSAALARLSGARRVVGFARTALREPAARFGYKERVNVATGGHVIQKNLELARAAGASEGRVEFPLDVPASGAEAAIREQGIGRMALINPGAAWPNKCWPPDRFGAVSRHLRDRHGLRSVVLWGPGEADRASGVVLASDGAAVAAPATSLRDLVSLGRVASLMVSGDTGPMHIAAAAGTPLVALFGPTDPGRNGPWHADDVSVSHYGDCDCHYERRCRRPSDSWCLGRIGVDAVIAAVDRRLALAAAGGGT